MIPLQFIGNKRSGTSQLCLNLNKLPDVFCTNESDVAWLLYQMDNGSPEITDAELQMGPDFSLKPFARHPLDVGSAGAVHTMRAIREYGAEESLMEGSWRFRYEAIQHMEFLANQQGKTKRPMAMAARTWVQKKDWKDLHYVGDKMPTQVADPKVFDWFYRRFPETRFLHIVRNPSYVVASMRRLGYNTWWKGSIEEVLRQWTKIELQAISIAEKHPHQVLRVKQEEMAADPQRVMDGIADFLGVARGIFPKPAHYRPESAPALLPDNEYTAAVMKEYGYG